MISTDPLFQLFDSRNLKLANRIVMAPMTRSFSPRGIPGKDVAAYYRRRAEGGVGLIITEGTAPEHPAAASDANVPLFHGDALKGWAEVLREVHAAGGKIAPQLWHVGGLRKPGQGHFPDAPSSMPSGLHHSGKQVGQPLTEGEIAELIAGYAKSAGYAKALGFDGIEVHGAHGYLIDQFFWERTNQRTDRWGGSIAARTTFAAEVIRAIRRAVGPTFPIILRFSQWKQQEYPAKLALDPAALETFLAPLTDAGVDIFHCSTRRFWEPEFEGSTLNLAGWTKKISGLPTITVGSIGLAEEFIATYRNDDPAAPAAIDDLVERLGAGEFDLVALGRMLIVEPEWPKKVRAGRLAEARPYSRTALATLD